MNKKVIAVGIAILVAPLVAHFEGLSRDLRDYWDPHGEVATACYGHTETAVVGKQRTHKECAELLLKDLESYAHQVDILVTTEIHPNTLAALSSFSYNVGIGTFKKSSVLKKINNGDIRGGCEYLKKYVFAGGKKLNGLVKRRKAEYDLCMDY